MNWNAILTTVGYIAGAAAIAIPTMGVGLPLWVTGGLTALSTLSAKMAASHSQAINTSAAVAQAAGAAAKAASDATRKV